MVLVGLLRPVLREGLRRFSQYYRLEGKAFDKLYSGFPRSRTIGRGVRHGLTVGSVAGSLINDSGDDGLDNGSISFEKRQRNPPRSTYKTRRRQSRRSGRRCPTGYRSYQNR